MSAGLPDLLACVAAFARSLEGAFHPQRFLVEFSARAQALVPHDGMLVAWLEDEGRTFSAFARHVVGTGPLLEFSNYTIAFDPSGRFPRDAGGYGAVFDGESQLIADIHSDLAWGDPEARKAWATATGFRGRVGVPLYAGGRVVGALLMGSIAPGRFTEEHVTAARQIADLIGPFVESVVLLQRERRRRERLQAVTAMAPLMGASLKVGDVLERLGAAVRPALDVDGLGLSLLAADGERLERVGFLVDGRLVRPSQPVTFRIDGSSLLPRVRRGEVMIVRNAAGELDQQLPVDRYIVDNGIASAMAVPLMFGERMGGAMFFGKRRPNWYDAADAEIAVAIAQAFVLAVQHQRLADEQQRLAVAQASAHQLEQRVRTLRGALEERFGFDTILGRSTTWSPSASCRLRRSCTGSPLTAGVIGTSRTSRPSGRLNRSSPSDWRST